MSKIVSGEIYQSDLVWCEGMADWQAVARVPGLAVASWPATSSLVPLMPKDQDYSQIDPVAVSARIPNYLWQSIAVTVCGCCPFFGIPAIIYATKVDKLSAMGDYQGAMEASKKARLWCLITVGAGLIVFTILGTLVSLGTAWAETRLPKL